MNGEEKKTEKFKSVFRMDIQDRVPPLMLTIYKDILGWALKIESYIPWTKHERESYQPNITQGGPLEHRKEYLVIDKLDLLSNVIGVCYIWRQLGEYYLKTGASFICGHTGHFRHECPIRNNLTLTAMQDEGA